MSVIINELEVTPPPDGSVEPPPSGSRAASAGGGETPDLERLGYELARRVERQARLWAD